MPGRARRGAEEPRRTRRRSTRRSRIEQIDGNISFFKNDVPAAFTDVTDAGAASPSSRRPTTRVIAALADYKTFLQNDLLPKSKGYLRVRRRHVPQGARGRTR